jgi:hypothetical protein
MGTKEILSLILFNLVLYLMGARIALIYAEANNWKGIWKNIFVFAWPLVGPLYILKIFLRPVGRTFFMVLDRFCFFGVKIEDPKEKKS